MDAVKLIGLVVGGPLDGKLLANYDRYYRVPLIQQLKTYTTATAATKPISAYSYVYEHFRLDRTGFWIPLDVRQRSPIDGRTWDDPLDYLLAKLSANYRPAVDD